MFSFFISRLNINWTATICRNDCFIYWFEHSKAVFISICSYRNMWTRRKRYCHKIKPFLSVFWIFQSDLNDLKRIPNSKIQNSITEEVLWFFFFFLFLCWCEFVLDIYKIVKMIRSKLFSRIIDRLFFELREIQCFIYWIFIILFFVLPVP